MATEPSSQYLPVAAGGTPETGNEGKAFSQSQQRAGGLPKAPFSRALEQAGGGRPGCPGPYGRQARSLAAPPCLSSLLALALSRVLIYSTASTPAPPGGPGGPSFLLLMTRRMQKAQLLTREVTAQASAWE